MKLRLNVNAIVKNERGEILVVELKGGPYKGGFCIPGGGVEPEEMSEEVARREVMEETGIEIDNFSSFGFCELIRTDIESHRVVLLLEGIGEGVPKETEEGYAKWMDYDEAMERLIPFARESLRIWKEGKLHFKMINDEVKNEQ